VVCQGVKEVSLKEAQSTFQKTITWMKNLSKRKQEWEVVCHEASLLPQKLNTLIKTRCVSKVVLFQETLKYAHTITFCYSWQSLHLQAQVPFGPSWEIV
jgi:hypothetical protein